MLVAAGSLLLLPPAALALQAPTTENARSQRERLADFDYVWQEIAEKYYDPRLNGVDWAAARARYRPLAAAAADEAAFHAVLLAMVGELRDAHTRVLTARQATDRRAEQTTTTGATLFEVQGQPVVFDVRPGSPASEAGLRRGMRVLRVNGVPIVEAVRREREEVGPSSSERAALVLAYLRLTAGAPGEVLRLQLAREDGSLFDVELARRVLNSAPHFESRVLPSGHLYVKFDRFREPVARLFSEALRRAHEAPGLIIDLRSNPGGDGKEGMKTLAPFLDRPTLIARLATRTGKAPSALMGLVKLPLQLTAGKAGGRIYSGPVGILVNQGTASTAEVVAAGLQERGLVKVFGTRSCGCALGVLKYRRLKSGGALTISEVGLLTGLGRRIEGEGVVPDVTIELGLRDFQSDEDAVLEAAVRGLSMGAG
jgi:carboxyl-terminal processing protease